MSKTTRKSGEMHPMKNPPLTSAEGCLLQPLHEPEITLPERLPAQRPYRSAWTSEQRPGRRLRSLLLLTPREQRKGGDTEHSDNSEHLLHVLNNLLPFKCDCPRAPS